MPLRIGLFVIVDQSCQLALITGTQLLPRSGKAVGLVGQNGFLEHRGNAAHAGGHPEGHVKVQMIPDHSDHLTVFQRSCLLDLQNRFIVRGYDQLFAFRAHCLQRGAQTFHSAVAVHRKRDREYAGARQNDRRVIGRFVIFRERQNAVAELRIGADIGSSGEEVVEDINHRFTKEVITREFESGDLARSARNLRRDRFAPNTILDDIDTETFTEQLKSLLEILDEADQTVKVADVHAAEIKEYLVLLDLIYEIDSRSFPNVNDIGKITVVSQPGMRYAQAQALVKSLLLDDKFKVLNLEERTQVIERILSEIRGRMMEDIILLETKLAQPKKEVFKLQFTVGEFDMVVFDPETASCEIYEIKYSTQVAEQQYQHLVDEQKCAQTEHRFGKIKGKYVLYRGATQDVNGIHYVNVEEYLNSVCKS